MRKMQYFNNVIYKHVKSLYSIEKYLKIDYAFKNKKYVGITAYYYYYYAQ